MTIEGNEALVYRLYDEFFNQGNMTTADELFAPNYVNNIAPPGHPLGPEGVKRNGIMFRTAFPDFRITIEDMIAKGDKVVVRYLCSGTHQGTFLGVPPTGKKAKWAGIDIYVIAGGKFVGAWGYDDLLGLMQQLGAFPRT